MIRPLLALALLMADATGAQRPPERFGDGLCALAVGACGRPPRLAVLAAFPAELDALLARAMVRETLVAGERVLRIGTIAGTPVVLGMLGIGLRNAAEATRLVLDRFPVDGVVVSGVAGAAARIGDVTVPARWTEPDGSTHAADPAMLEVARRLPPIAFERCTPVPPEPPGAEVCLGHEPALLIGGGGRSDDPFGDQPFQCDPAGGEVFGCDVAAGLAAALEGAAVEPDTVDMETAAVAREATGRGLPFIAFRAVSDGAGDPLDLPGFPAQFFAYYHLAAHNAAAAAAAFIERWGGGRDRARRGANPPLRARASCGWERRATAACAERAAPRAVRRQVARACRLLARDAPAAADAWLRAADRVRRAPVRRRLGEACGRDLEAALRARAAP